MVSDCASYIECKYRCKYSIARAVPVRDPRRDVARDDGRPFAPFRTCPDKGHSFCIKDFATQRQLNRELVSITIAPPAKPECRYCSFSALAFRALNTLQIGFSFSCLEPFLGCQLELGTGGMMGGGGRKGAEWPKTENSEISVWGPSWPILGDPDGS